VTYVYHFYERLCGNLSHALKRACFAFRADEISEEDEAELRTVDEWVNMMAYFEEIESEEVAMDLLALQKALPDEDSLCLSQ
jgi:hypothetical protein